MAQRAVILLVVCSPLWVSGGPAYVSWSGTLPVGQRGVGKDHDGDGLPNGVEFVIAGNPAASEPGAVLDCGEELVGTERFGTVTFRLVASSFADVSVGVQASGDLVTWTTLATLHPEPAASWIGPGAVTSVPWSGQSAGPGVLVTARDVVPLVPGAPRYLRLVVHPVEEDRDDDGLPGAWERSHGLDPDVPDAHLDLDGDGVNNGDELLRGARPDRRDTDGDGRLDGFEVAAGTDPATPDGDGWTGSVRHPGTGLLVHLPGM